LRRAIANLVDNALHYGTRARIVLEEDDDGSVVISVKDDGPGIPAEQIERVLQPFVRLDRARARDTVGLGLGLAIVSRAVEEECGALTLSNRAQGGLCAEIRLPPIAR
jgi:signal transduction histidine kinase